MMIERVDCFANACIDCIRLYAVIANKVKQSIPLAVIMSIKLPRAKALVMTACEYQGANFFEKMFFITIRMVIVIY